MIKYIVWPSYIRGMMGLLGKFHFSLIVQLHLVLFRHKYYSLCFKDMNNMHTSLKSGDLDHTRSQNNSASFQYV